MLEDMAAIAEMRMSGRRIRLIHHGESVIEDGRF